MMSDNNVKLRQSKCWKCQKFLYFFDVVKGDQKANKMSGQYCRSCGQEIVVNMKNYERVIQASENDHSQLKWLENSVYFDENVSKFPGIFPDRCSRCYIIFEQGGNNSFLKSDKSYSCYECERRANWLDFFDILQYITKDCKPENVDEILDLHWEIFEEYSVSLFISVAEERKEANILYGCRRVLVSN